MDFEPVPGLDARRMLAELDFPAVNGRRGKILDQFAAALDPLIALLGDIDTSPEGNGKQTFGITSLLARGITDLLGGGHLASHCYLAQAYTVMRPVHEACDLIELFARNAAEAETWVDTEEGHKHFTPGAVRKRLGQPKFDEAHDHFTESGSHPRFKGAQLGGLMRVARDDPDDRTLHFRIGPFYPEHPAAAVVWLFAFDLIVRLGFKTRHLEVIAVKIGPEQWLPAYIDCVDAVRPGLELVGNELVETGGPMPEGVISPADAYAALADGLRHWQRHGEPPDLDAVLPPDDGPERESPREGQQD